MHRPNASALGLAALLVVAACSDQSRSTRVPTAPSQPLLAINDPCDKKMQSQIASDQRTLFSGTVLKQVQNAFDPVVAGCPNTKNQALAYLKVVRANQGLLSPAAATLTSTHVDHVFSFVGLPLPAVSSRAFLPGGAACVLARIGNTAPATCITDPQFAGVVQNDLTAPSDYDYRLYTLVPTLSTNCLGSNLKPETQYCYDLGIFPAVPAPGFSPPLNMFVCLPTEGGTDNPLLTLGHLRSAGAHPGTVEALTRWPNNTSAAPYAGCDHDGPGSVVVSSGMGSAFARFLASIANTFRPATAYAVNGGLGITDDFADGTSPVGAVNLQTFFDNYNTDVVGTQPAIQTGDVGSWFVSASSPASITVVSSLGDLTSQPVLLNQGQGACAACPVMQLVGTMANSSGVPADVGSYEVRFQSLEDKPSVKGAPVILQSAEGLEIARLSYSTESSTPKLRYNGVDIGVPWVQHVHQDFVITVNVDAKTTTLTINGAAVPLATNVAFVNASASNLAKIAWIFGGIDAGIIAVDNVSITRLIDP